LLKVQVRGRRPIGLDTTTMPSPCGMSVMG
jgi:hypothetical protein